MENSKEEIYEDAQTTLTLSRLTPYHSAIDLDDISTTTLNMEEQTELVRVRNGRKKKCLRKPKNPNYPEGPKACTILFRDNLRIVDYVLVWIDSGKTTEQELIAARKRASYEARLKDEGLQFEVEELGKFRFVKIHATKPVLRRYCEVLRLRMPMKEVPGQDDMFNKQYGLMTEVRSFFKHVSTCIKLDPNIFPPDKFRLSAEYSRHKSYLFDENGDDFFSPQVRTMVVNFILERTSFSEDTEHADSLTNFGLERITTDGIYKAAYPLHDGSSENKCTLRWLLLKEWASLSKLVKEQPIDQIREYFGVRYALYFAWLGFYTHMLIPASIAGLLVFFYGIITLSSDVLSQDVCNENLNITMCPLCDRTCDYWKLSQTCTYAKVTYLFDNPVTVIFAVFMSFWAALFLELWKRYSASITHRWGLSNFCLESEPPRPEYLVRVRAARKVRIRVNPVSGLEEPYPPFWTVRLPAVLMSITIVITLILVAVAAVLAVILYRISVLTSLSLNPEWDNANISVVLIPVTAAIINLVCIMILNWFYDKLANYLTELEMYRTQTEFDEALTVKIYLFQFVNYYTSIIYIAFLKGKFIGYPANYNRIFGLRQEECHPGGCLMELSIQLAIIMIGQQALNSIQEMLIPLIYKWINTLSITTGLKTKSQNETDACVDPYKKQWTEDYKLLEWGSRGLFYEYLEMVMQYGFVTLFVTAFPLAPLFALLNNVLEMRLDARKFLVFYRRPVPRRTSGIGAWYSILNFLGRLAVISNAFIIAFSSNFIPKLVYKIMVSKETSYDGFLEHSLAYFDTKDFYNNTEPRRTEFNNTETCRYAAYRHHPTFNIQNKYELQSIYWHILAARLAFVVVFQNLVSLVMIVVGWSIPDVPHRLKDQIKREAILTSELIIEFEKNRVIQNQMNKLNKNNESSGETIKL